MSRFLGDIAYPFAKAAERASIRLGTGDFGVRDGYKCVDCHRTPTIPECRQCRVAWAREVGSDTYSDAYERRMNVTTGTLCVVMASSAWVLNNALGWWEFGPLLASLNAVMMQYVPDLSGLPAVVRCASLAVLWVVWGVSLVGVLIGVSMSMFLLCMHPNSKRHWRHMTPSAIVTLMVVSVVYFVILLQRVYILDGLLVVVPAFTGLLALLLVPCMRKPEDAGDERDLGKLV